MQFMKNAKELARNPLGIIALFISLIYGFASLLLNSSADKLTVAERWPLIAFIVIFPLLVLGVFYRLVTRHHGKLYAPGDYHKDRSFMRTLSPSEQEQRLTREVRESLGDDSPGQQAPTAGSATGHAIDDADVAQSLSGSAISGAEDMQAERQTDQANASEAVFAQHRNDLIQVKDRVLRQLMTEEGVSARRRAGDDFQANVRVGDSDACFDALVKDDQTPCTFVEVKVLKHRAHLKTVLEGVLYSALVADRLLETDFRLLLAVVVEGDEAQARQLEQAWAPRIRQCPVDIELRILKRSDVAA